MTNKAIIMGICICIIILAGCDELTPKPPIVVEKSVIYAEDGTKLLECNGSAIMVMDRNGFHHICDTT